MPGIKDKVVITFSVLFCSITAEAGPVSLPPVGLPPVNLGETSFQDGIANPGWLLEETINYYEASQFKDAQGGTIPGSNELTTISAVTHLAYISRLRLLGGYFGAEVLLPLVDADLKLSSQPRNRARGVGDLIASPFILQWNDHQLFGMPYFHRFDIALSLPTGQYDAKRAINAGNNIVSLNPYYAFTILPADKVEVSARLHYLWNSENDNPYTGLGASSIQPGQALMQSRTCRQFILANPEKCSFSPEVTAERFQQRLSRDAVRSRQRRISQADHQLVSAVGNCTCSFCGAVESSV